MPNASEEGIIASSHFLSSDIADRMGVPFLQRTLSIQLTEHILKCLPDLKRELQARYRDLSRDVAEYRASSMFDTGATTDTKALVGYEEKTQFDQ